jgi:putative sigma-54 modulation protein
MQLNLSGHHVDITEAMRNKVEEKLAKLERHFDHLTNVQVILSVDKLDQKAEATLHLAGGGDVHAMAVDEDMYTAIDALIDKLDRQVIKHKEKIKSHRGNGHRDLEVAEVPSTS